MNGISELSPQARELSKKIRSRELIEAREPVIDRALKALIIVLIASVLALGFWFWATNEANNAADLRRDVEGARRDAAIASIQDDLKDVCRKVSASALAPSEKDSCFRAEANIPPSQIQVTTVPQSFLDNAALLDAVKVRVDDYLAMHPMPTAADILPLVRQTYNDNKPADGKTPSDTELLGLIAKVYSDNPPSNGKDATQDQADQAIASYCAKQPGGTCQGPKGDNGADGRDGDTGPQGDSVTRQYFGRDDSGDCRSYNDFSDGRTKVDEGPASDAACPVIETTEPTPST